MGSVDDPGPGSPFDADRPDPAGPSPTRPPRIAVNKAKLILVLLPILFWIVQEIHPFGPVPTADHNPNRALCLLLAMALWWVTESFPLHWTALLPLLLIPLLPVVSLEKPFLDRLSANAQLVAAPYVHAYIFLFLGGMLIGLAMEEHNLHRRIALNIIRLIGSNPRRLLLGFVLSTCFISLWISNTATAVMMVPIAFAVVGQMEAREGRRLALFGQSIMLSIAYGANVGGIGTLIGTAPNMIYAGFVNKKYGTEVGFLDYLPIGFPFVLIFLPAVFAMLAWLCRRETIRTFTRAIVLEEIAKLGRISRGERKVLVIFAVTCASWIFNEPLRSAAGLKLFLKADNFDASVAMSAGLALFLTRTLTAPALRRFSWDVLILLGGSFALSAVVEGSGLSRWLADQMRGATALPPLELMLVITTATIFVSAFTSNMATCTLMMGLVADAIPDAKIYLAGVVVASSCDFMLPAGTPPNAIVFGTRYVRMRTMVAAGAVLDLTAAVLAALWVYFGASLFI